MSKPNPHVVYSYLGYLKTQRTDVLLMCLATAVLAIPMIPELLLVPGSLWLLFLLAAHHEMYWHNYTARRSNMRANRE